MKDTIKHQATRASTWGLILSGLASLGEGVPVVAQYIPGKAVAAISVISLLAKIIQNSLTKKKASK